MQFLSDLSILQRAGGAAILVILLVLLLVKQRQTKATPVARSAEAKPMRGKRALRERSGKPGSLGRARKGKQSDDSSTPAAEPKATSGRMVPRLPAADVGGEFADLPSAGQFDPLADAEADDGGEATDGMISEPGWPTPGEVWTSPDPATGYGDGEHSLHATSNGVGESDDPLAALTETPEVDAAGWATDDLDGRLEPASGWSEPDAPADGDAPAWEKEQAEFDWTAAAAEAEWSATNTDEATDEISSAQAAWEAPEDDTASWPADELWEMPKEEQAEVADLVATAVAEDEFTVGEWAVPEANAEPMVAVEEPAEVEDTPAIIWEPIDEVEEVEPEIDGAVEAAAMPIAAAIAEPVETPDLSQPAVDEVEVPAPTFPVLIEEHGPVVEGDAVAVEDVAVEPVMDEPVAEEHPVVVEPVVTEPVADEAPAIETEIVSEPVITEPVTDELLPVIEHKASVPEPVAEEEPTVVPDEIVAEPIAEELQAMVEPEVIPSPVADEPQPVSVVAVHAFDAPALDDDGDVDFNLFEVEEELVQVGAATADPVARWASMMPGGSAQSSVDPVSSWSRLQPGSPAATVGRATQVTTPAARAVVSQEAPRQATPAVAEGIAWWDVPSGMESDPRRGRFALGGYALQPGHQVVSGVTFRDGVVPPPSHWVIGPVVGDVAPGTLVLEVDGCLNCRPQDVAVLMDHGFAPTIDGFSLRLTASETGPFAASGTYVIS